MHRAVKISRISALEIWQPYGAVKYDVQQAKVKDGDKMIDMIFENSKFDQNNARLEEARNLNSKQCV